MLWPSGTAPAAAAQTPASPTDAGPVSISLEDVGFRFLVEYLGLTLEREDVRMAYMDIAPAGASNGRTVVLLDGLTLFGEYWGATIEALRRERFRVVAVDQIGFSRSSKPLLPCQPVGEIPDAALRVPRVEIRGGVPKA